MPNETGEIRHQLFTDLGDRLEAHGLYVAFITFVLLLVIVMTIAAIHESRPRRPRRESMSERHDRLDEEARRQAGIDEGFRRGFHG